MYKCLDCCYNSEKKYNLDRHIKNKHKNVSLNLNIISPNLNNISPNLNNISPNLNNISPNLNNISPNLNIIQPNLNISPKLNIDNPKVNNSLPNQCDKYYKIFTVKNNLTRHSLICKGINKDKLCIKSLVVFL
jgi:hypothetical protein